MKEPDFFDPIRHRLETDELPFEVGDWQSLRDRLDAATPVPAHIPPKRTRRMVWVLGMGLAAGLLLLLTQLPEVRKSEATLPNVTQTQPSTPTATPVPEDSVTTSFPPNLAAPIHSNTAEPHVAKRAFSKKVTPFSEPSQPALHAGPYLDTATHPPTVATTHPKDTAQGSPVLPAPKPSGIPEPQYAAVEEEYKPFRNNGSFFFGAGINRVARTTGYTAQAGWQKPIGRRTQLVLGLGMSTGNREVTRQEQTITQQPGHGIGSAAPTYDTTYTVIENRLPQSYAQALVAVNQKLYRTGSVGVGADVSSLLVSRQTLDTRNAQFENEPPTARWNVRVGVQYQQTLHPRVDLSLSYRRDISSRLQGQWENDALQFILLYRLSGK